MKKTIALLLAVLTVLLLTVPALALTGYELFTRWEQDGYPEDVTGVFYNTETQCLAILLTDNTEARQKAIRESLTDGDTLTFFPGRYSHAELEAVRDVIAADVENGEPGLISVSIGWGSSGGYGEEQKDFRVVVKAEKESVAALTEKYAGYGDLVAVEEGQTAVDTPADVMEAPKERQGLSDWGIIGIAAVVAVLIAVLLTRAIDKSRAKKGR